MISQLIESPDEHHWVLLDHRITEVAAETRTFRVQTWSLDGSIDLRVTAPCALRLPSGVRRDLDPAAPETLAPLLGLVGVGVRSLTITREGRLSLALVTDATLELPPSTRAEAWSVQGGGVLEGMAYEAAGGGPLWPGER